MSQWTCRGCKAVAVWSDWLEDYECDHQDGCRSRLYSTTVGDSLFVGCPPEGGGSTQDEDA